MRRFYFVRHGESEGNIGAGIQGAESPLTENGQVQAERIAKRVADLEIDHIVSSTMKRAHHTAEVIATTLKKEIEFSDLFVERRRPTESYTLKKDAETFLEMEKQIITRWHETDWHYSDEENFTDLKLRAEVALQFLKKLPQQHILVVTHGFFLRALVGSILFKERFSSREMTALILGFQTTNTGITYVEYDDENTNKGWLLRTLNDFTHLPH